MDSADSEPDLLKLVNATLEHAKRRTAFYQDHLANTPNLPLRCLTDLSDLPLLTREEFRRELPTDGFCGFRVTLRDDHARYKPAHGRTASPPIIRYSSKQEHVARQQLARLLLDDEEASLPRS